MGGAYSIHRVDENCEQKIMFGKLYGKRPLGTPIRRGEGNSRHGLKEMGWEIVDWIKVT
jgi:hypothetical protein